MEGLVPTSSSDNSSKRLLNSITMQIMMGASPKRKFGSAVERCPRACGGPNWETIATSAAVKMREKVLSSFKSPHSATRDFDGLQLRRDSLPQHYLPVTQVELNVVH